MKKLFVAVLMAAVLTTPLYAVNKTFIKNLDKEHDSSPWKLEGIGDSYVFLNLNNKPWPVQVYLNEYAGADGKAADKVSFICNGVTSYLTQGTWTQCDVEFQQTARFMILPEDFHNGAEGIAQL
jgi:hypothetical protein